MKKLIFLFPLILWTLIGVQAEENNTSLKIGFEVGGDWHSGLEYQSFDRIRKTSSSSDKSFVYDVYDEDEDNLFLSHSLNSWYVGLKPEFVFWKRLGLAAGVRFSSFTSTFEREGSSFFYWKVEEDGVYTDFVRIRKMEQTSYYVGIPLEARLLMGGADRVCRFYFKLGSVLNFHCQTKNEVDFVSSSMSVYEDDVDAQIPDPSAFTSYIYPAVGFRVGRNIPLFNVEFHFPSFMIERASSLLDSGVGCGVQFSVQFPVWESKEVDNF